MRLPASYSEGAQLLHRTRLPVRFNAFPLNHDDDLEHVMTRKRRPETIHEPGTSAILPAMDDVDKDVSNTTPIEAPPPESDDALPLQSEDGEMFLHSEDDTDY